MKFYQTFHYLSLDIVLGALASSCLAAGLFKAQPDWSWWLCLALTVWLLYTGDHLLDAWRHRKKIERKMHYFMLEHRRNLIWFMGVTATIDVMLIVNLLDKAVFKYVLALAALVLLFYAFRHLLRRNRILFIPGEFFVMVLYMAGTWLGPIVVSQGNSEALSTGHALVSLMFASVLLMNLGIISLYDIGQDTKMGLASLAGSLGKKATRTLVIVNAILVSLLALLQFLSNANSHFTHLSFILLGMTIILLTVLFSPSYFRKNNAYRLSADAVLYLGFLALLA